MLVNPRGAEILRLRSHIIHYLRNFLVDAGFLDVATPIIAGRVGGATARPFITSASEFPNKELKLRIAPELWLKRLVLAGFDRVFEIGPSFRNEGIDATHNPEFTTCEFYQSFADIEELIELTQNLLRGLDRRVMELKDGHCRSLPQLHIDFSQPFKRLEFVPAIEAAIGRALPNLSAPDATFSLQSLFGDMGLPLPASPTLPRLLDKLSATYIEPQCNTPTFVTHHPECLAPLAKSYLHNGVGQRVSARIELFVQHHELANAYEEENSPLDQRRKFVEQLNYREEDDPSSTVDETYLDALEWALPPTGGWGCGVDRLVMLFSGATRIADVLSFGTMRNVVALGSQAPSRADM
ncbi:MAG: hypothetical protein M1833_003643 [Piccolia ochrophora]|nr:MAG: hypothetical protein M1833_003643 [Piccolia ochrophora]